MNILHVTPYYAPAYAFGGVVRAVEGMAEALAARGHTVRVLTSDALSQTGRLTPALAASSPDIPVTRVRNRSVWLRGRFNLSTPAGYDAALRPLLDWADVVHTHEFRTVENVRLAPEALRRSLPLVLSPHGTLNTTTGRDVLKRGWDRLLSRRVARSVSGIIGLTTDEADEARALWALLGVDAPPMAVIPNGVDPDALGSQDGGRAFRRAHGLDDAVIVLFMGRLHARKGLIELAQAFQAVDAPDARLIIAGADDGLLQQLRPLLSDAIQYVGFLDGEDRRAALDAADVFALPATGEGLPMAALEAMAVGVPLLLSPGCHLPVAEAAGAALIVPPDVDSLAAALKQLLGDEPLRRRMSVQATRLAVEHFSWNAVAGQLEHFYLRLL